MLEIKINDKNYSINYSCHKNKEYNRKKCILSTFKRLRLKNIQMHKSSKCCLNFENDMRGMNIRFILKFFVIIVLFLMIMTFINFD